MRWVAAFALLALASCTPAESPAYLDQQWRLCQESLFPAQRIGACGAVIAARSTAPDRRAAALIQRGMQRSAQAQHLRAIADFGRALRIDANLVDAYIERGLVHQTRGAYESAIADFEAAAARDPGSRAAQLIEGARMLLANAEQSELSQIMDALAIDPTNAALWNQRCWLRAVRGEELEYALGDCNEALRLAPNDPNIHDSRGLVNLKRGDFQAALIDYQAAVAIEPANGHFRFGRGIAHVRLGQKTEGEADLAEAERLQPGVTQLYAG
jgi:tetratricopeptide (TPR) repeat protein